MSTRMVSRTYSSITCAGTRLTMERPGRISVSFPPTGPSPRYRLAVRGASTSINKMRLPRARAAMARAVPTTLFPTPPLPERMTRRRSRSASRTMGQTSTRIRGRRIEWPVPMSSPVSPSPAAPAATRKPFVVIVMPAYNAAKTLEDTFRRIPEGYYDEVVVVDDHSRDETTQLAQRLNLKAIRHPHNVGYGGNQKTCYMEALRDGADIVIMLHPD